MKKTTSTSLLALLALLASPALSQTVKTVPQVQQQINDTIKTGSPITAAILNSALNSMVLSYASRLTAPSLSTTYTMVEADRYNMLLFNNASPIAVTLPQAGSGGQFGNGWRVIVVNNGVGAVTITSTTSSINGTGSLVLNTYQSAELVSNGTNYFALGNVFSTNSIGPTLLRQSAALSVMGNAAASTANVADIVGTANQVLRLDSAGTALAFGQVNLASSAAVTGTLPVANGGTGGTLPVAYGGTGATTAPTARVALNTEAVTTHGDSNYTILATDRTVVTSATLTTSRTWTLPAASAVNPGQSIIVQDAAGGVTGTETLTIARAGSDTINGATSTVLNTARAGVVLTSNGTSAWSFPVIAGSGTVTNIATTAPLIGGPITGTGTVALNATVSPQGRLTLTSGEPVLTTSVTAQTTVYYTPYLGNLVPIYDGTNFTPTAFAEVSQTTTDTTKSPAAVVSGGIYDIFCWVDSGTKRCTRGPAWTDTTTRSAGTALVRVNGVYLNNASITNGPAASRGTYVGTIAANPAAANIDWKVGSYTAGGGYARYGVWNMYNRVAVATKVTDSTASYANTAGTWGAMMNSTDNSVYWVAGLAEDGIHIHQQTLTSNTASGTCLANVAIDTVTTVVGVALSGSSYSTGVAWGMNTAYDDLANIGSHTFYGVIQAAGGATCTQYGAGASSLNFNFRM